jgi:hypothetical protein
VGDVTTSADRPVRLAAAIVAIAGAVGSVALTIVAGHRNPSVLLRAIFAAWVLTPFVALAAAGRSWVAGSQRARAALLPLTLVVTGVSLGIYGTVAFGALAIKTGFAFLVLPPALVSLVAVVGLVVARRTRP